MIVIYNALKNKTIALFDNKIKETKKPILSSEIIYIIDNKRVKEKIYYKADNE